jgi:hypothetical protein
MVRDVDEPAALRAELEQRRRQLATLPVIEQAKGMLMLLYDWDAEQSFAALREVSQATNTKLCDVAAIVLASGSAGVPDAGHGEATTVVLAALRALTGPDGATQDPEAELRLEVGGTSQPTDAVRCRR